MKKYTKYKKTDIDWIGEIPEHWKVKPLYTVFNENKLKNKGLVEDYFGKNITGNFTKQKKKSYISVWIFDFKKNSKGHGH